MCVQRIITLCEELADAPPAIRLLSVGGLFGRLFGDLFHKPDVPVADRITVVLQMERAGLSSTGTCRRAWPAAATSCV